VTLTVIGKSEEDKKGERNVTICVTAWC